MVAFVIEVDGAEAAASEEDLEDAVLERRADGDGLAGEGLWDLQLAASEVEASALLDPAQLVVRSIGGGDRKSVV